jgi:hypothetical protein
MRKLWALGAAAMLLLAIAAVAIAQDPVVTNVYTVDSSSKTTPSKAGTSKKPVPIAINFDYSIGEVDNKRPSPVRKYSIQFGGTQVNPKVVPACAKSKIDAPGGPKNCPPKSIVGSGFIENETGNRADANDKSLPCNASVQVVNGGARKAYIYVAGSPGSSDPRTKCVIELASAIPANFVRRGNATALEFTVPDSLLHPAPTLSNAVKRVTSTVKRVTKRIKGKNRGYFEAVGGCKNGKRFITVVFTPETGPQATAQYGAKCTK